MAEEAIEHSADFDDLAGESQGIGFTDRANIARGEEVVLEPPTWPRGSSGFEATHTGNAESGRPLGALPMPLRAPFAKP